TEPEDESVFLDFYRNLAVADALEAVSGVPVPPKPRDDIVKLLTTYNGAGVNADLLRLDMTVPPTPVAAIRRLGPFAHDAPGLATPDPAGFPTGPRPDHALTAIVVRAAGAPTSIAHFAGNGAGVTVKA